MENQLKENIEKLIQFLHNEDETADRCLITLCEIVRNLIGRVEVQAGMQKAVMAEMYRMIKELKDG